MTVKNAAFVAVLTIASLGVGLAVGSSQQDSLRLPAAQAQAQTQAPAAAPLPGDPNIFVALSKKVVPSVVNISTRTAIKGPSMQGTPDEMFRKFFEDFFGRGFGFEGPQAPKEGPAPRDPRNAPRAMSLGTGFIIDGSGLILTNNHVVAEADEIKIAFTEEADEQPTDGKVVGRDTELDVALIRVKSKRTMVPLTLGDSDTLEVGEYVVAVGNPFGQGHSVTHGIISAKGRVAPGFPLATYLQTDAPINPGNSGGPLVNMRGEVIGINNAIDVRAQGIGFAIPISVVKKILPQLKTKGSVERGYIGALVGEVTPELADKLGVPKDLKAPFITNVTPGEPADKAGLQPYDVVTEVNGKKVSTAAELVSAVTSVAVGDSVELKFLRNGKAQAAKIKAGKRPGAGEEAKPRGEKKKEAPHIETGMQVETLTPDIARQLGLSSKVSGVVVSQIGYGGPADRAGLGRGDIIVEVDRKPVKDVDSFYAIVKDKKSYLLRVLKEGGEGQEVYAVVVLDLKS